MELYVSRILLSRISNNPDQKMKKIYNLYHKFLIRFPVIIYALDNQTRTILKTVTIVFYVFSCNVFFLFRIPGLLLLLDDPFLDKAFS